MSWDRMQASQNEGNYASKFIKLKDKEHVEVVFIGEPYCFFKKFKDPNEYDKWAEGRSFKFRINAIVKEANNTLVAKIFEQGSTVRDLLLDQKEEHGLDCVYKIKRVGSGIEDTRYSIFLKEKLTPVQVEMYKMVPLNPLKSKQVGPEEEGPPPPGDEDCPF